MFGKTFWQVAAATLVAGFVTEAVLNIKRESGETVGESLMLNGMGRPIVVAAATGLAFSLVRRVLK